MVGQHSCQYTRMTQRDAWLTDVVMCRCVDQQTWHQIETCVSVQSPVETPAHPSMLTYLSVFTCSFVVIQHICPLFVRCFLAFPSPPSTPSSLSSPSSSSSSSFPLRDFFSPQDDGGQSEPTRNCLHRALSARRSRRPAAVHVSLHGTPSPAAHHRREPHPP